ncbi:MAG: hypothetical protein LBB73_00920 [Dysgonamonadaceae bacterium]|nr:hypothetical protein [Dysgonamonadaceae bacterium]
MEYPNTAQNRIYRPGFSETFVSAKYDNEIKAAGKNSKKSKSSKRKKRKSRPKSGRNTGTNHLPFRLRKP